MCRELLGLRHSPNYLFTDAEIVVGPQFFRGAEYAVDQWIYRRVPTTEPVNYLTTKSDFESVESKLWIIGFILPGNAEKIVVCRVL